MPIGENEFILQDRLGVIRDTINKYGEENFYLSFSGGKDSTVVHHLLDMAVPGNKIPRVFSNTGLEFKAIVEFVKSLNDERVEIIQPKKNVPETLQKVGYPFKSKAYSNWLKIYQKHSDAIDPYFEKVRNNEHLLDDYDFVHSLPVNAKCVIKSFYGVRERERESFIDSNKAKVPNVLRYQFTREFNMKISDQCCVEFKEKPLVEWQKENNRPIKILGLMREEGGRRNRAECIIRKGGKVTSFQPLAKVSKEWEEWFIREHNIELCELYYEPYNFTRTGCVGCPYNIQIQEGLEILEKYLPQERKQAEYLWKPVYEEYRRLGYRLKKEEQTRLF